MLGLGAQMDINPTRKYRVCEWVLSGFLITGGVADVAAEVRLKPFARPAIEQQRPAEHEDAHTHQEESAHPFPATVRGDGIVSTATVLRGTSVIGVFPGVHWPQFE
jgi:hypothetical protein